MLATRNPTQCDQIIGHAWYFGYPLKQTISRLFLKPVRRSSRASVEHSTQTELTEQKFWLTRSPTRNP